MRKMTREQLQSSYDAKSKEADLLNLYLVDREYFAKEPIRAQWSDERDTVYDAAWYRADSASEGYIVIRYFLLTDGRRGNPEGMPSIYSFTDLSERRFATMPTFAAYIIERLQRNRYRQISCPDIPGTVSRQHFAHSDRVHQGFCYHCQVWLQAA